MIKKLYVNRVESDRESWNQLLSQEGIKSEANIEETFGLFDNEILIGTASRYQNVIKCVAVDSTAQGGAYFNQIISHLMNRNTELGYFKHYVYTKAGCKQSFEYLGFKEIEQVDQTLIFMESAVSGFPVFLEKIRKYKVNKDNVSSIVMNANPFTLGHQLLVETAAIKSDHVFVFVLSEEMSLFTTEIRTKLVKLGTAHLNNVTVLSTDNYMVSNATFPSYFLKESDDITSIQARLDAKIFANHIADALNIKKRYVGSEPFSIATNLYNNALRHEFKGKLELEIIERFQNETDIISATKVRNMLINDELSRVIKFVPKSTYDFLVSDEGKLVIKKMKAECNVKI